MVGAAFYSEPFLLPPPGPALRLRIHDAEPLSMPGPVRGAEALLWGLLFRHTGGCYVRKEGQVECLGGSQEARIIWGRGMGAEESWGHILQS